MIMIREGMVVKSIAGKDRGKYSVVLSCQEGYVMICDGKHHRLANPKRKNPRHLEPTNEFALDCIYSDKAIKKLLGKYNFDKSI
jgi:ribosomal protein L14E/L6E/L27E